MTNTHKTFDELLSELRIKYSGDEKKKELGDKFELLTCNFFKKDLTYKKRFSAVYQIGDWENGQHKDTGVDLVAIEAESNEPVAIQCKCYADNNPVTYNDISRFVNGRIKLGIEQSILVTTSDKLPDEVLTTMARDKTQLINKSNFRKSSIKNWDVRLNKLLANSPKNLRTDQRCIVDKVIEEFKSYSRGKMLMACGTGKTLTSFKITEELNCKTVLYLVPSISLIQQTMREWSDNSLENYQYIAVCSDPTAGKRVSKHKSIDMDMSDEESRDEGGQIYELERTPSTNVAKFIDQFKNRHNYKMTIIFSTYQSIDIVKNGLDKFNIELDLILCDEAHRTATRIQKQDDGKPKSESHFAKVHNNKYVSSKRRLYMTATPRIYHSGKNSGYSMDDEDIYGPTFASLSFYDAVHGDKPVLSDFKVKIAVLPEDRLPEYLGMVEHLSKTSDEEKIKEAKLLEHKAKYAAAWHGILKPDDSELADQPLQKVIVFTNRIEKSEVFAGLTDNKEHGSFKEISGEFSRYYNIRQTADVRHIDGGYNSFERRTNLDWLDDSDNDKLETRIISNARCLSEGVDVPSLDGVIFLEPKDSTVDVVQSVGRVMRKSCDKDFGYIILPVIVPGGNSAQEILENSRFKHVWQVLNALRSHDPRLIAELSSAGLVKNPTPESGTGTPRITVDFLGIDKEKESALFSDLMLSMRSKLVKKVGNIDYIEKYGTRLGTYARKAEELVKEKYENGGKSMKEVIDKFHADMQEIINERVTIEDSIKMISQHMILKFVFDHVFTGDFTSHNPVSRKLDQILKTLNLGYMLAELGGFYSEVKREAEVIRNSPPDEIHQRRQEFIRRIYGHFVSSAEKKTAIEKGIVYTPSELIDFIINSVEYILKKEMKKTLGSNMVQILEPFAGTGSFLTQLIKSGYLDKNLEKKYLEQLYANEILLLGYYIAAVNMETTYSEHMNVIDHKRDKKKKNNPANNSKKYIRFKNINYVDTFEQNPRFRSNLVDLMSHMQEYKDKLKEGIMRQNRQCIEIIIGNPPWGVAKNIRKPQKKSPDQYDIQSRVDETYGSKTTTGKKKLHELYVRSLRWSTDRLGNCGIIAFVINGSMLRASSFAGVRAFLQEEFNTIYYIDCRGGKGVKGDGRNIFEYPSISTGGTTSRVGILILVKKPNDKTNKIFYHKLDDKYQKGQEKRDYIKKIGSIRNIPKNQLITIKPNSKYEWIDQSSDSFSNYIPMESKSSKDGEPTGIFEHYVNGVVSGADTYVYNSSKISLKKIIRIFIEYMNNKFNDPNFKNNQDLTKGKWTDDTVQRLRKVGRQKFNSKKIRTALYRPFFKQQLYFDWVFNARWNLSEIMPYERSDNLIMLVSWGNDFSVLITDVLADLHVFAQTKCFPFYKYHKVDNDTTSIGKHERRENINDQALDKFRKCYDNKKISKIDIFYYIYAVLHHPEYRSHFKNDLVNNRPHIPFLEDFKQFRKIGEKLVDLHLNYEKITNYHEKCNITELARPEDQLRSIKFGKDGKHEESVIVINSKTVFDDLPKISFRLNGRTPLGWLVDRSREYAKPNKKSGHVNDIFANVSFDDLVHKIKILLHVGLVTDELVSQLPQFEIMECGPDMAEGSRKTPEFRTIQNPKTDRRRRSRY